MHVEVDIKDRNGIPIELDQDIAVKVSRRSGSYSSWYRRTNKNHFTGYWVLGRIKLYTDRWECKLRIELDQESVKALEQPMGKETITQCVDSCVNLFDRSNFDARLKLHPGMFLEDFSSPYHGED